MKFLTISDTLKKFFSHPARILISASVIFCSVGPGSLCAQEKVEEKRTKTEEPNDYYGKGGKKVTTVVTLGEGIVIEGFQIFDPNGKLREHKITSTTGRSKSSQYHFLDCNGDSSYFETKGTDGIGGEYYREIRYKIDKNGNRSVRDGYIFKVTKGDTLILKYDSTTREYVKVGPGSDSVRTSSSYKPNRTSCIPNIPRLDVFVGYSLLIADFENGSESMSGWAGAAYYNLNKHWAIGLYASGHNKSTDDLNLQMYFFQGAVKYNIADDEKIQRSRFAPYGFLGFGVAKLKTELEIPGIPKFEVDDQSLAASVGTGLRYRLYGASLERSRWDIGVEVNYTLTNFNDEMQNNFRVSAGVGIGLFRPQRAFPD